MRDLRIPDHERYKFAEPLDRLIPGIPEDTIKEVENIFREKQYNGDNFNFYLVGDIVTRDFLNHPFLSQFIKLCIIDEKTKRKIIQIKTEGNFEDIFEIENPKGWICKESWPILRDIISSGKKTLIKVMYGEEDLLVLPLIMELPINKATTYYAFYGQPPITDAKINIPQGIVVVEVNKETQEKVGELIEIMEEIW